MGGNLLPDFRQRAVAPSGPGRVLPANVNI
jgi:hypothetical protein